jgi:hypothetical protein
MMSAANKFVIPAQAGIQPRASASERISRRVDVRRWMPTFVGMTK